MEPSNVLIALEEWEKWRSRKARLERDLAELRRRREEIEEELERVKREMATIEAALMEPADRPVDAYNLPPFHLGR